MNRVTAVLIVTSLGLGAASAYFHSQLNAERSRAAALEARVAELEQSRIPATAADAHEADAAAVADTPAIAVAATSVPAVVQSGNAQVGVTQSTDKGQQMRERFMRRQQALMNDPEYREAMRMQQRMALSEAYSDLARELGLPQEQVNRLLDLLADQQMRSMEAMRPLEAVAQADPAAIDDMRRRAEERQRTMQAEIAQVLGPDGMQRWQDYQNSMGSRSRVRQLSGVLEAAGIPLREDQQQALQRVLADHEQQVRQEAASNSPLAKRGSMTTEAWLQQREDQLDRQAQIYERARNAASGVLSTEQLDVYRQLQERELTMQRAQLRVQRAQMNDGDTIEPGSAVLMPATVAERGFSVDAAGH